MNRSLWAAGKLLVHLLVFGNVWIALCALAMTWQTEWLLGNGIQVWQPYSGVVFFGTLSLYGIHRLVGLRKVSSLAEKGRFARLERYRKVLMLFAATGLLGAGVSCWGLHPTTQLAFLVPAALSALYVWPIYRGKRLRDVPYVKIFLISVSWALLTVWVPSIEWGLPGGYGLWLACCERAAFIFALTLPFDIRDLDIDAQAGVPTLPASLGIAASKMTAVAALALSAVLAYFQLEAGLYRASPFAGLILSLVVAAIAIWQAHPQCPDLYYSVLIDGFMVIQFGCVLMASFMIP